MEQWQLVGLITQRSQVRVLPPLPILSLKARTVSVVELFPNAATLSRSASCHLPHRQDEESIQF